MSPQPTRWAELQWGCVICWVLIGSRAAPAVTMVAGDPVCGDHVRLRAECVSLPIAIREAHADLGERSTPIVRRRQ